jgi:hypothetical protein
MAGSGGEHGNIALDLHRLAATCLDDARIESNLVVLGNVVLPTDSTLGSPITATAMIKKEDKSLF